MNPISNRPKITSVDILNGYVNRYFVKYIGSPKIVEISKEQYFNFVSNRLYQSIEIKWIIGGNDIDILTKSGHILYGAKTQNENQITVYEQLMPGLRYMLPNTLEYFSGKRIPEST